MKKIIILTLACAAVALPLAAQENEEAIETDSAITEQAINANHSISEYSSYVPDTANGDDEGGNGLMIAVLVISLLSLLVSMLSFIQNKKNMSSKDVNTVNDVERQIANMQQQLLQMKKLMEEMLARQSNLLGEFVAKLGTVQQVATFEQPAQKTPQQYTQQTISTSRQQSLIKQQRQSGSQQNRVEPLTQEHTIYVKPSIDGSNIVLTPVSEAYADRATFVIKTQGDKGTYAFNKAATKSVISYLDNMLTPYCECSLLTNGSVSSITPTGDGTVEKQGDKWLVISKAQVSIS